MFSGVLRFAAGLLVLVGTRFIGYAAQPSPVVDLAGHRVDPFSISGQVDVLLFARSDCPITKRYAPELGRIAREFQGKGVTFWLVFPDRAETVADVQALIAEYHFPGTPLLDASHELVKRAHATVAPEASVFDKQGRLIYHGRIDDLYIDIGKSRQEAQSHDLELAISAALSGTPVKETVTRAVGCSLADVE